MNFKEAMQKSANEAKNLPSFPQKGVVYNISTRNNDFKAVEDWTEQENNFGKMVRRKQTVYIVNTKEGILRISPNQMQQLSEVLGDVAITDDMHFVQVKTEDSTHGLLFLLVGA
jgi:hypothetical protein